MHDVTLCIGDMSLLHVDLNEPLARTIKVGARTPRPITRAQVKISRFSPIFQIFQLRLIISLIIDYKHQIFIPKSFQTYFNQNYNVHFSYLILMQSLAIFIKTLFTQITTILSIIIKHGHSHLFTCIYAI